MITILTREVPFQKRGFMTTASNSPGSPALTDLHKAAKTLIKEKEFEQATDLLQTAEKTDAVAQYLLGICYYIKEPQLAFAQFASAASLRYLLANHELGLCFLNGNGVNVNRDSALENFRIAAAGRDKEAQFMVAYCLQRSKTLLSDAKKTETEVVQYLLRAVEKDHPDARFSLGKCYEQGFGVAKDPREAQKHFIAAAKKGHLNAKLCVALAEQKNSEIDLQKALFFFLNKEQRERAALGWSYEDLVGSSSESEAFLRYKSAAEKNDFETCFRLGLCYAMGIGVAPSYEMAFKRFSAARGSIPGAQLYLGLCFANGWGTEVSEKQASKYLCLAIEKLAGAEFFLGLCCFTRHLYHLKQENAVRHFQKSADMGFSLAKHMLALCLFYGIGIGEDKERAFSLLGESAAQGCLESREFLKEFVKRAETSAPAPPASTSTDVPVKEEAPRLSDTGSGGGSSCPSKETPAPAPPASASANVPVKRESLRPTALGREGGNAVVAATSATAANVRINEADPLVSQEDAKKKSKCCCSIL